MIDAFSLWLVPEAAAAAEIAAVVADLASELNGPVFAPHLTLIEETARPRAELERAIAEAAAGTSSFDAEVARVEVGTSYYRSLYLRFDNAGPLRTLKQAMIDITEPQPIDAFMPHISLYYGENPARAEARDRLHAAFAGRAVRFERIVVIPSGRLVPIEEWTELASFDLKR